MIFRVPKAPSLTAYDTVQFNVDILTERSVKKHFATAPFADHAVNFFPSTTQV